MQLQTYVRQVQDQLAAAAALGDDRTRHTAQALAAAAEPAIRLAVLAAMSAAADEITAALLDVPGAPTVTVRLAGVELRVDVHSEPAAAAEPTPHLGVEDGDASARISLRLPDVLKTEIEAAARAAAISVNTWLVRAATGALADGATRRPDARARTVGGHRITGWVNG